MVIGVQSRKVDLTIYRTGRINISAHVSKLLGLSVGDVLDMAIDKQEGEYYLFRRICADEAVGRHAGRCYPSSSRTPNNNCLRIYSREISDEIFNVVSPPNSEKVIRLLCGCPTEMTELGILAIPIITRQVKR